MSVAHYLEKYSCSPLSEDQTLFDQIITIPAHRELNLASTLDSLIACDPVPSNTAVFVLLNYSGELDADFHHNQLKSLQEKYRDSPFPINIFIADLPMKKAGVGLARKMLMDQAARQLVNDGVIVCLDADCTVSANYLSEVHNYFLTHPKIQGASIHYEHPLNAENARAILEYELHLRYYVECQRWLGLPYAYHTVGSSMAVRNETYCKTGGMNQRKAGEDFYFLQKIIPHGFGNIHNATVYPSPRVSVRVPFGTGRAMDQFQEPMETYAPISVQVVKLWLDECLNNWDKEFDSLAIPRELESILLGSQFEHEWQRIAELSKSYYAWKRQFFAWFDGFRLMKILHGLRDTDYPNVPVIGAATWLLETLGGDAPSDPEDLLIQYRILEKLQGEKV